MVSCNDVEVLSEQEATQIVAFHDAIKLRVLVFEPHNARSREDDFQFRISVIALTQFRTPIWLLENLVNEQHLSTVINEVGSKICDATALEIEVVHVDIQALPIASGKLLFGIL
mgnify:CR=1 FL=1